MTYIFKFLLYCRSFSSDRLWLGRPEKIQTGFENLSPLKIFKNTNPTFYFSFLRKGNARRKFQKKTIIWLHTPEPSVSDGLKHDGLIMVYFTSWFIIPFEKEETPFLWWSCKCRVCQGFLPIQWYVRTYVSRCRKCLKTLINFASFIFDTLLFFFY